MGKFPLLFFINFNKDIHRISAIFDPTLFKLAGSEHFHETLDEFEFRTNCILYFHCPESAPNVTENLRLMIVEYGPFQTTATFQRLHHLSCLCKSGYLCTEADLSKYCYLLR